MAFRRRGTGYLVQVRNGNADRSGVIPYKTWRSWLDKGKITEERLLELGINPAVQRRRVNGRQPAPVPRRLERAPSANVHGVLQPAAVEIHQNVEVSHHETRPLTSVSGMDEMEDASNNSSPPAVTADLDEHSSGETDSSNDNLSSYYDSGSSCSSNNADIASLSLSCSDSDQVSDEDGNDFDKTQSRVSSVLQSKKIGVEVLNQPLAHGLEVTKFETLLMIFHLAMRHSLTDVFLEDITNFVNHIVGVPEAIPGSKWLFQKLFMFGSQPDVHFFCPNCDIYLGPKGSFQFNTVSCDNCEWVQSVSNFNEGHYFVTLSIKDQLKTLLERPNLKLIATGSRSQADVVADVMDGEIYQKIKKKSAEISNSEPLTISISTDGSPVYKNGRNTLYPIHFHLNEIPAQERFNVENLLLAGLWFSKRGEPNLQIFLKPLVEELRALSRTGIVWKNCEGKSVESPVFLFCCCTDTVARPKVQNVMQFNGVYGCSYCLHPNTAIIINEPIKKRSGIRARGRQICELFRRRKVHRFLAEIHTLRTNKMLRKHMKLATRSHLEHIYGAKGMSVVCDLSYVDMVFGFPLDYMHLVLLGVLKRLVNIWFDSTSTGKPYYIGLLIDVVSKRLSQVTPPSSISKPRPLSERAHWKAKEWRAFLLYYGLPCLFQILPDIFFNHFKRLVTAIYILCKETISHDEIEEANILLHQFVHEFQIHYGEANMVFNVHGLGHLATQVAKTGPLWAYSMFPFESANGRLLKIVKGTRGVAYQIARKYLMTQQICKLLLGNYNVTDKVLEFCSSIVEYKYTKHSNRFGSVTLLGKPILIELSEEQKLLLRNNYSSTASFVNVYNRALRNKNSFSSRQLGRQKNHNDSCVRLGNGTFAVINLIIAVNETGNESDICCLGTELNIALNPSAMPAHIKQCSLDPFGSSILFSFSEIREKCFLVSLDLDRKYYIAELCNTIERSL